jgi:hypothetical protein
MDNEYIRKIRNIKNPEILNDYLILLSKNANKISTNILDFIINDLDSHLIEKVKINIIYLLGEVGKVSKLEDKFYQYLLNNYFESDRWIRDEILQAFIKISDNFTPNDKLIDLLSFSINEDYVPIKEKTLELLSLLEKIPTKILLNLMTNLDSVNSVIVEKSAKVLKQNIKDHIGLIDFLNNSENYKQINKRIIRSLLINYIDTTDELRNFENDVLYSEWELEYRNLIMNEIKIYNKLLLKGL